MLLGAVTAGHCPFGSAASRVADSPVSCAETSLEQVPPWPPGPPGRWPEFSAASRAAVSPFSCVASSLDLNVPELCDGLGDAAAMPTISIVKKFRKEFEDHLEGRPCPYDPVGTTRQLLPLLSH